MRVSSSVGCCCCCSRSTCNRHGRQTKEPPHSVQSTYALGERGGGREEAHTPALWCFTEASSGVSGALCMLVRCVWCAVLWCGCSCRCLAHSETTMVKTTHFIINRTDCSLHTYYMHFVFVLVAKEQGTENQFSLPRAATFLFSPTHTSILSSQ